MSTMFDAPAVDPVSSKPVSMFDAPEVGAPKSTGSMFDAPAVESPVSTPEVSPTPAVTPAETPGFGGVTAEQQKSDPFLQIGADTYRGVRQLGGLYKNFKGLGQKIIGNDDGAQKTLQDAAAYNAETEAKLPRVVKSVKDIGSVEDATRYASENVFEQLPIMAPSMLLGGVGGIVGKQVVKGAAVKAAEGLTGRAAASAAAKVLTKGMVKGATVGAGAGAFPMNTGETVGNLYQATGDVPILNAIVTGTAKSALDVIPEVSVMKRWFRPGIVGAIGDEPINQAREALIKKFGKAVFVDGMKESVTEVMQNWADRISQKVEDGQPIDIKAALDEDIDTAAGVWISTGVMGGVGEVTSHVQEGAARSGKLDQLKELRQQRAQEAKERQENLNDATRLIYSQALESGLDHNQAMEVATADDPQAVLDSHIHGNTLAARADSEAAGRQQEAQQLSYPDVTPQIQDPRFKLYTDAGYDRATAIRMVQEDQAEESGKPITSPDGSQRATPGRRETSTVSDELRQKQKEWDTANRTHRSDEWFAGANIDANARQGFSDALVNGGDQIQAHGMAKERTMQGAVDNLSNLLRNNLDPNRGGGRLDTAPLVNRPGEGLVGATPTGSAYSDGPFILVVRPGTQLNDMRNVSAILVNQTHAGMIDELRDHFQAVRPDLIVETYANAGRVVSALNNQPISLPVAGPDSSPGGPASTVSPAQVGNSILQAAGVQDTTGAGAQVVAAQVQSHVEQGAPIDAQAIADATGQPVDVGALADAIEQHKQTISPSEPVANSIRPMADNNTRTEAETGSQSTVEKTDESGAKFVDHVTPSGRKTIKFVATTKGHRAGDKYDAGMAVKVVTFEPDKGDTSPRGDGTDVEYISEIVGKDSIIVGKRRATYAELKAKRERFEREQDEFGSDSMDERDAKELGYIRKGDRYVFSPTANRPAQPTGETVKEVDMSPETVAAAIRRGEGIEPPIPAGMVRLYRAEPSGETDRKEASGTTGRFWSPQRDVTVEYGDRVYYVDVPEGSVDKNTDVVLANALPGGVGGKLLEPGYYDVGDDVYSLMDAEKYDEAADLYLKKNSSKTEIIPASRDLKITNIDQLPRGTGARYLEVTRSHKDGEFVAMQWRRKPVDGKILIDYDAKKADRFRFTGGNDTLSGQSDALTDEQVKNILGVKPAESPKLKALREKLLDVPRQPYTPEAERARITRILAEIDQKRAASEADGQPYTGASIETEDRLRVRLAEIEATMAGKPVQKKAEATEAEPLQGKDDKPEPHFKKGQRVVIKGDSRNLDDVNGRHGFIVEAHTSEIRSIGVWAGAGRPVEYSHSYAIKTDEGYTEPFARGDDIEPETEKPASVFSAILDDGEAINLANGWRVIRSRIGGEPRIEVKNIGYNQIREFEGYIGGYVEKRGFESRFFIPTERESGVSAIEKMLTKSPIMTDSDTTQAMQNGTSYGQIKGGDYDEGDAEGYIISAGRRHTIPSSVQAGYEGAIESARQKAPKDSENARRIGTARQDQEFGSQETFAGIDAIASSLGIRAVPIQPFGYGKGFAIDGTIFVARDFEAPLFAIHEIGHILEQRGDADVKALVSLVDQKSAMFKRQYEYLFTSDDDIAARTENAVLRLGLNEQQANSAAYAAKIEQEIFRGVAEEIAVTAIAGDTSMIEAFTDQAKARQHIANVAERIFGDELGRDSGGDQELHAGTESGAQSGAKVIRGNDGRRTESRSGKILRRANADVSLRQERQYNLRTDNESQNEMSVGDKSAFIEDQKAKTTEYGQIAPRDTKTPAERQLEEVLGVHEHGAAQGKEEAKTEAKKKMEALMAKVKAQRAEAKAKQAEKINALREKAGLDPRKNPTLNSAVEVGKAEEQEKGRMMSLEYSVDKAFQSQAKERGAGVMDWLDRSAEHLAILDDQLKVLKDKSLERGIIEDALRHTLGEDGARLAIRAAKHNVHDVLKYVREVLDNKLTGAHRRALSKAFDQYYQQQEGIPNPRMDKLTDEAKERATALLGQMPTTTKVGVTVADLKGVNADKLKTWFNEWKELMAINRLDREVRIGAERHLAAKASEMLASEVSENHENMTESGIRPKSQGTIKDVAVDFYAGQSLLAQRAFGGLKSLGHKLFYRSLEQGENDYKATKHKAQSELGEELKRLGVSFMDKAKMMTALKPIKAGGQTILMTDAERMHLAAFVGLMDDGKITGGRLIARHHILRDGFIRESMAGTTAKITGENMPEIVADIIKTLTPAESAIVRKIIKIQTGMGEAGNRVSRQLLGRSLFTEDWYMGMRPERVSEINADELGTNQAAQKFLENSGFTKTVVEHRMPIKIGNIFAAFDDHVDGMSRYVGLTIPLRNIRTAMKANDSILTRELNSRMGTNWTRRVTQTIMKLAGARSQDQHGVIKVLSNLSGNVMRSVLAWNPSSYFNNRVPGAIMLAAAIAEKNPKAAAKIISGLAVPTQIKTASPIPLNRFGEENERVRAYLMEHGYLGDRWSDDYSSIASPVNRDVESQLGGKAKIIIRHVSNMAMNPMMHAEIRNGIDAFKALRADGIPESTARDIVADATRATQNSSSPLDDSAFIQGVRDFGLGGLFPFLSQNVVTRNFLASNIADGDKKGAALAVAGIAASITGTILFHALMRSLRNGPDDDEDKAQQAAAVDALNNSIDTVLPGTGMFTEQLVQAGMGQYSGGGGGLIFERPLGEMAKFAGSILNGKPFDLGQAGKVVKALTQILGLPTGGLYSVASVAHGVATDYEPDTAKEKQDRAHNIIANSAKRLPDSAGEGRIRDEARRTYWQAKRDGLLKPGTTEAEFRARYKSTYRRLNP